MGSRRATLHRPIRRLFNELARLNVFYFNVDNGIRKELETLRKESEKWEDGKVNTASMYSLLIGDLTIPKSTKRRGFDIAAYYVSADHELLRDLKILRERVGQWICAQAFELFETFLYDTVAAHLSLRPELVDGAFTPPPNAKRKNINYWQTTARRMKGKRRGGGRLLSWLRKNAPGLGKHERKNFLEVNLPVYFKVWAKLRHIATHNDGVVPKDHWRKMSRAQRRVEQMYFPLAYDLRGRRYILGGMQVNWVVQHAAEYAYLIFKMQAQALGIDWESVIPKRDQNWSPLDKPE